MKAIDSSLSFVVGLEAKTEAKTEESRRTTRAMLKRIEKSNPLASFDPEGTNPQKHKLNYAHVSFV